ncbi:MAG: hypothetical protein ABSA68_12500 [Xanthobacteraceae bacterium]|jgi:hypothetical protein
MPDDIQQVENQVGREFDAVARQADLLARHQVTVDRSFIVKRVVYLYIFSIGAAIVYLIGRTLYSGEDRFQDISELIKVAVIPVLTLVIGYYFGTSRS